MRTLGRTAGYRGAFARYRDLGLRFDLALTVVEAVALVDPAGIAFSPDIDEARQILADLSPDAVNGAVTPASAAVRQPL